METVFQRIVEILAFLKELNSRGIDDRLIILLLKYFKRTSLIVLHAFLILLILILLVLITLLIIHHPLWPLEKLIVSFLVRKNLTIFPIEVYDREGLIF